MIMIYYQKKIYVIITLNNNNNIFVDVFPNVIVILLVHHHQLKFIYHEMIQLFEKNKHLFHYHHINIIVNHLNDDILMKVYISLIHIIKILLNFVHHYQKQKNRNNLLLHVDIIVKINIYQQQMLLIFLLIVCKQQ
jgi:hypothetical protein